MMTLILQAVVRTMIKRLMPLLLLATPAFAQTSFYTGQATQAVSIVGSPQPVQGPIPFAGVRVCNLPLTQTAPCLPLATITDSSGNTLSNSIGSNFGQFTSDSFGRFTFGCTTGANLQLQYTGASNTPQASVPITCPGSGVQVGGNNTFSGNNTFGPGSLTVTGLFQCKNFEGAACVDNANSGGWTGSDACAQMNTAQGANLPSRGGSQLDWGLSGVINCATSFAVGSSTQGVQALLGPVDLIVNNTVTLEQGSSIQGTNGGSGSVGTTPTVIQANNTFPASTTLLKMNPVSLVGNGQFLRDFQLQGADVAATCLDTNNAQEVSTIQRVAFIHCLGTDVAITGTSQQVGIYDTVDIGSSAAGAAAHNGFTVGSASDGISIFNGSSTKTGAQSTGACVQGTSANFYIFGMHCENHADGVLVTGAGNASPSVIGLNGLSNVGNLIHISSTFGGSFFGAGLRKFTATNTIKNDNANFNGATQNNGLCTDENVSLYAFNTTTTPAQLITTCSQIPSKFRQGLMIGTLDAAPDANTTLELTGDAGTFSFIELNDTNATNPRKIIFGTEVAATNNVGWRDFTGGKNLFTCNYGNAGNNNCIIANGGLTTQSLTVTSLLASNTAPTIAAAGCGGAAASIVVANGTAAFKVNVGTTPTSACTLTFPAATTGWNVTCVDITTNSTSVFLQKQTGVESTTSVTITNFNDVAVATAFVASDILKCTAAAD